GHHHGEERGGGIEEDEPGQRRRSGDREGGEGGPRRPAEVEARHGGVGIAGLRRFGLRSHRPDAADRLDGVDDAVAGGQEPGRGQGVDGEADQAEDEHPAQDVSPLPVAAGRGGVEHEEHEAGNDEVGQPVPDVPEPQEGVVAEEVALDPALRKRPRTRSAWTSAPACSNAAEAAPVIWARTNRYSSYTAAMRTTWVHQLGRAGESLTAATGPAPGRRRRSRRRSAGRPPSTPN